MKNLSVKEVSKVVYVVKQKIRHDIGSRAKFDVFYLFTNGKEMRRFLERLKKNGWEGEVEIYEAIRRKTIKLKELKEVI